MVICFLFILSFCCYLCKLNKGYHLFTFRLDSNGCINENHCRPPIVYEDETESENIKLYPNPYVQGTLKLELPREVQGNIIISSLEGKRVFAMPTIEKQTYYELDLNHLSKGMYLLHIEEKGRMVYRVKWIKNE